MVASGALTQQLANLVLKLLHLLLEGGSPVPHVVTPLKHQVGLGQKGLTKTLRFATPVDECLEITKEMCPAQLTPESEEPVVG